MPNISSKQAYLDIFGFNIPYNKPINTSERT